MASVNPASDPAYPLEISVEGRAVSDNRLKQRFTVTVHGKRYVITEYTDEANAWMDAVRSAAAQAIRELPADIPHPREWNLPLIFSITWRRQRIDPLNGMKGLNDALAPALDVDDRFFEFDRVHRERIRGKTAVPGAAGVMIRVRPATEAEMIRPRPKKIAPLQPGHKIAPAITPKQQESQAATPPTAAPVVIRGMKRIPDHLAAAIAEAEALAAVTGAQRGNPAQRKSPAVCRTASDENRIPYRRSRNIQQTVASGL